VANVADRRSRKTRFIRPLLNFLIAFLFSLTLVLLSLQFVSYPKAKTFFDSYIAADISGNSKAYLPEQEHNLLIHRLLAAAGVVGISGSTLLLFRRKLAGFLADIPLECRDIRASFRDRPYDRKEAVVEMGSLFAVVAIGIFLRLWHVRRAVRFDEAWTYIDFASKPLVVGLSNYRAPNNHLLNTLLIHFSTLLLGNTALGLRLPSLVAGCLVIIATWFVTRALYGRLSGILAGGCIAALPTFIEFSVNARGYALQWLSILGMIWCGYLSLRKPTLKIPWLGFVLAAVVGVYTIPTTLIPMAGVFAWILWSTSADGTLNDLVSMSKKVALAALAISALSAILYIPPLIVRGLGALMAKDVVDWQQLEFAEGLKNTVQCAWLHWTDGVPRGIVWMLLASFAIGLLFFGKTSKRSVSQLPISITIALWISAAVFVWARHVFAFPRVWSYLLLSAVMTAAAGLSLVLSFITGRRPIRQLVVAGAVSVGIAVLIGAGVIKQQVLFTTNETGTIIDADQIVDFLAADLRPGDSLVSNAIIKYDLRQRNPRLYKSLAEPTGAAHLVAVAVKSTGQTEVCQAADLWALTAAQDTADPQVLASQIHLNGYSTPRILARFLTSTVYSLDRKEQ
jgi:uncharacterized membrane protein